MNLRILSVALACAAVIGALLASFVTRFDLQAATSDVQDYVRERYGRELRFEAPLVHLSKADIIREGVRLGVDYGLTVSCYQADVEGRACGRCDSCRLRREGFVAAGVPDPTRYV